MLRPLALAILALPLAACATIDHQKIRESRPVTVGFIGAHFRPDGDHALMVEGTNDSGGTSSFRTGYEQRRVDALHGEDKTKFMVNAQYVFYPGKTSTFFWGAGAAFRRGGGSFLSVAGDETSPRTSYTVDSTYVSIPLGWTDIFEHKEHLTWLNGLTFSFDIGPRVRVSQQIKVVGDDEPAKLLERERAVTFGGGNLLIGWSF